MKCMHSCFLVQGRNFSDISVCASGQVYGQGISVAAMEAEALRKLLQVIASVKFCPMVVAHMSTRQQLPMLLALLSTHRFFLSGALNPFMSCKVSSSKLL